MYTNITRLHRDCEIGKSVHKMIWPFLERKEDETDTKCYRYEFMVL